MAVAPTIEPVKVYCQKCRDKMDIVPTDHRLEITAKGMLFLKCNCPSCGGGMTRVMRKATDEEKDFYPQLVPDPNAKKKKRGKKRPPEPKPVDPPKEDPVVEEQGDGDMEVAVVEQAEAVEDLPVEPEEQGQEIVESSSPLDRGLSPTDPEFLLDKARVRIQMLEDEVSKRDCELLAMKDEMSFTEGKIAEMLEEQKSKMEAQLRQEIEEQGGLPTSTLLDYERKEKQLLERVATLQEQNQNLKVQAFDIQSRLEEADGESNQMVSELQARYASVVSQLKAVEDAMLYWEKAVCVTCNKYRSPVATKDINNCTYNNRDKPCPAKLFWLTIKRFSTAVK